MLVIIRGTHDQIKRETLVIFFERVVHPFLWQIGGHVISSGVDTKTEFGES